MGMPPSFNRTDQRSSPAAPETMNNRRRVSKRGRARWTTTRLLCRHAGVRASGSSASGPQEDRKTKTTKRPNEISISAKRYPDSGALEDAAERVREHVDLL